jgi:hypothetical protein
MIKGTSMHSCLCSQAIGLKKLLILGINRLMLCYFPHCVVLQGNVRVFGRNIDQNKMKARTRVKNFLATTFKKFYVVIWFCMKLEDVLEVLPMLMPNVFLD